MMARNVEWELLGVTIAQFARVGAKPWELRLMALKGERLSFKDISRLAFKYECDVQAPRLRGEGEADEA